LFFVLLVLALLLSVVVARAKKVRAIFPAAF
jgi:hypothetical protein